MLDWRNRMLLRVDFVNLRLVGKRDSLTHSSSYSSRDNIVQLDRAAVEAPRAATTRGSPPPSASQVGWLFRQGVGKGRECFNSLLFDYTDFSRLGDHLVVYFFDHGDGEGSGGYLESVGTLVYLSHNGFERSFERNQRIDKIYFPSAYEETQEIFTVQVWAY
jgi:hypothetical protein